MLTSGHQLFSVLHDRKILYDMNMFKKHGIAAQDLFGFQESFQMQFPFLKRTYRIENFTGYKQNL